MTADEQLVTELADLREALVEIARAMNPLLHDPLMTKVAEEWVDEHILPVVLADRRRAVAEALRAEADWHWGGSAEVDTVCFEIRARADAVEAGDES